MADSTTFRGDPAQLFVSETPQLRRSGERAPIDTLRDRVRDLGADLKRNWVEAEPAFLAEARPNAPAMARRRPERCDPPVRAAPATATGPVPLAAKTDAHRADAAGRRVFAVNAADSILGWLSARRGLALKSLLCALLGLATAGLLRDWPTSTPSTPAPPASPVAWIDIAKPYPLFELVAPSLGPVQPAYTARRHAAGGGREDVLTFGQFGGPKTFLRIGVYRHGGEEVSDSIYFVDMARRASASGLGVTEADLPQAMPTRFGDFESGALELSGPENVKRRNCRGFRLDVATPALTMGGFMCGAGDEKVGAADLACVIDRLGLLAAGQDRDLADFFGAAGRRKSRACVEAGRRK
jgi:hypothetical protein